MYLRRAALLLLFPFALPFTTAWADAGDAAPAPAIEMSESANSPAPGEGRRAPKVTPPLPGGDAALQGAGKPAAGTETSEAAEPDEAVEASEDAAVLPAGQPGAPGAAQFEAPVPNVIPDEPVPLWRKTAALLGLAADPHPGEVAEPAPLPPPPAPDYIIGAGDVLGISVWRDDNLTRSVVVLPDGKIAFPLAGDLVAGGKTVAQLKGELERKLARYITDAGLTLEVKQSNSMIIYVLGRVNVPGRQMMLATTNVLQGLALAGGLNPYARRSEVKVYRKQEGKTSVFSFNYDDVAEGRHLETNIDLQKGDVILVP